LLPYSVRESYRNLNEKATGGRKKPNNPSVICDRRKSLGPECRRTSSAGAGSLPEHQFTGSGSGIRETPQNKVVGNGERHLGGGVDRTTVDEMTADHLARGVCDREMEMGTVGREGSRERTDLEGTVAFQQTIGSGETKPQAPQTPDTGQEQRTPRGHSTSNVDNALFQVLSGFQTKHTDPEGLFAGDDARE